MNIKTIRQTITEKGDNVLNVYFTAGHPTLESVGDIIHALASSGVDLVELGMPYSDPLADGPTIQQSSEKALNNGQTIANMFDQIKKTRAKTTIPIILMGYFNQLLQYGVERFLKDAHDAGVQGLIVPDLPMDIYEKEYLALFEHYNMEISFLITPLTSNERIAQAERLSSGFLYVVSQSSITGKSGLISDVQLAYFQRIKSLNLSCPTLIGFGIHDRKTRLIANQYANGVIVGSAFIRMLDKSQNLQEDISGFIKNL